MSPDDRKRKLAEMAAHRDSEQRMRELERDGRNVFVAFGYVACVDFGVAVGIGWHSLKVSP